MDPQGKYRPFPAIKMEKRMWPERQITQGSTSKSVYKKEEFC